MIVALFTGSLLQFDVSLFVASLFIVCMVIPSLAFGAFLPEVLISTRALRASLMYAERPATGKNPHRARQTVA